MLIDLAPNCDKFHVNPNIQGSRCRGDINTESFGLSKDF